MAPIAALAFLPYLGFLVRPPVAVAMVLLAVSGTGAGYSLGLDALVRDTAPPELFARTMAISTAGLMTIQGVGFAAAGALAQALPPDIVIAVAGACGLVTVLLLRPPSVAAPKASPEAPVTR